MSRAPALGWALEGVDWRAGWGGTALPLPSWDSLARFLHLHNENITTFLQDGVHCVKTCRVRPSAWPLANSTEVKTIQVQ